MNAFFAVLSDRFLSPVRYTTLLCLVCLNLGACSGGWFGDDDEDILPGTRLPVLRSETQLREDPSMQGFRVTLPAPLRNNAWPQPGGTSASAIGQLSEPVLTETRRLRTTQIDAGEGHAYASHLVPSPVVAEGMLFSMDGEGIVTARNIQDNYRLQWRFRPEKSKSYSALGGGLSYANGAVFITYGNGHIVALDIKDGTPNWERQLNIPLRSAPRIYANRMFITTVINQSFALDTQSGRIMWKHQGVYEQTGILGSAVPAVKDNIVVIPYSSGEVYALDVESGREVWRELLMRPNHTNQAYSLSDIDANPVIANNRVYVVGHSGLFVAIDLISGRRIWEQEISSVHTPWVTDDFIYAIAGNQLLCIFAPDGRIRWAIDLLEIEKNALPDSWSGPVLAGEQLYIANGGGYLMIISPYTGETSKTLDIPETLYGAPAAALSTILFPTRDGDIVVIQ